jgi:hypothetical protein
MKISGIMPLRNAVKLAYPFEAAIRSLRLLCDEVVVLVDPGFDDDAVVIRRLKDEGIVDKIVWSTWNMDNHEGHTNCEITVQTRIALEYATGDWVFSLQADELLHENEIGAWRYWRDTCEADGDTALEVPRLYFYGNLTTLRQSWTIPMVRFFKRGCWQPDVDGAMRFDPIGEQRRRSVVNPWIYHYSRIGDPTIIAERVRNLDRMFHPPERVAAGVLAPYTFEPRKLDTYVLGHEAEADSDARLTSFPLADHPRLAIEHFHPNP